ncbi:steroid isomerase [Pelomyxa schiedti]|nr:steroid isomerase [Pelomyxa schiedti]
MNTVMDYIYGWKWEEGVTPLSSRYFTLTVLVSYLAVIQFYRLLPVKPLELRWLSKAYNVYQVVFSAIVAVLTSAAVIDKAFTEGPYSLFCERESGSLSGPLGLCVYTYHLNKYVEFMDTFFIVARKKPVIFLHQFHHIIIVIATWTWLWSGHVSGAAFCTFINSVIHFMMYYYYYQCDQGFKPTWKQLLTTSQIVQLLSGQVLELVYAFTAPYLMCGAHPAGVWVAILVNTPLIMLFVNFFRKQYIQTKRPPSHRDKGTPDSFTVKHSNEQTIKTD